MRLKGAQKNVIRQQERISMFNREKKTDETLQPLQRHVGRIKICKALKL